MLNLIRHALPCAALLMSWLPAQWPAHTVNLSATAFPDPVLARSGDIVVALACVGPNSTVLARSADGGRTWPVQDVVLGSYYEIQSLISDGGRFFALVKDNGGLWLMRSLDGGLTWTASLVGGGLVGVYADLAVSGNDVVVAWIDNFLYSRRSSDAGATWHPAQRLDPNITSPTYYVGRPDVVMTGAQVNVSWQYRDAGNIWRIGHQRSTDGGVTYQPAAQTLMAGELAIAVGFGSVQMVAVSGAALLRSVDGGGTWSTVTGHGIPNMVAIDLAGNTVLAVGTTGQLPNLSYVLNVSLDGGATWRPSPFVLPTFNVWNTSAHVTGDALFVQFRPSYGTGGLLLQSDDFGANWRVVTAFPRNSNQLAWLSTEGGIVTGYAQLGPTQAYVLVGHTPRGSGTKGTGALEPRLAGTSLPSLGRTFALEVDQARGGAFGVLAFSFGGPAVVPLGAATLWIQPPLLVQGFVTSGAAGLAGAGAYALPVAVPNDGAFAGLSLGSQAFVWDPVAIDGFAATAAVETWMH